MSGGDIGNAASLYFEHQPGSSSSVGGTSANAAAGNDSGGINGNSGMSLGDSGEVRAPDPTRRTRLFDPDPIGRGASVPMPILPGGISEEMIRNIRESSEGVSRLSGNPFDIDDGGRMPSSRFRDVLNNAVDMDDGREGNNGEDADDDDEVVDVDMESNGVSNRARRLGDMFEPPTHLIYNQGGFQGARTMAKDSKRWLLVNLQSDEDFACHALNRDVWRNDLVENLVREGFIFWQSTNTVAEGQTYAQRYSVMCYPHIAIIDPRTGRLMWKREGWTAENPFTATDFAEKAADFCSHHSFDKAPMAPRGSMPGSFGGAGLKTSITSVTSSSTTEMTEDQQLAAAIQASMNPSPSSSKMDDVDSDSDDSVVIVDEMKVEADERNVEPDEEEEDKPPTFDEEIISMGVGEEPSGADGVARIMIRMPDGKRLIRKFLLTDTVKILYAFIAQCNDDAKSGKAFECKSGFPPKDLRTCVEESIESTGLAGETITVRWK